jgi:hypothetical protein
MDIKAIRALSDAELRQELSTERQAEGAGAARATVAAAPAASAEAGR